MKIVEVKETLFPEVKVIKYGRFPDKRGYFAETFKKSDLQTNSQLTFLKDFEIKQANISFSKKNVIRGLHFQWNPNMGKLVRTISGRMIDLFLDIRYSSPNFGRIAAWDMPSLPLDETNQLIWIPEGFAHGSLFTEDTFIEYYCNSEWNPKTEASITPLAADIDWSLCDKKLKREFDEIIHDTYLMSEKDKGGMTVSDWQKDPRAKNFIFDYI
jgi:dTDP-4-dehydrorhamnose 3,5-epimerase